MAGRGNLEVARTILAEFARRTGLSPELPAPRRYLWTDAFAVCDFLELHRLSGEHAPRELALRLVEQVHATLGRHRADDPRPGWISGLDEDEGRLHPTRGGLRIGKPWNERAPGEPEDDRLEWDRDGQYFHYLTKWMHALACLARTGGDERHLRWAIELAMAASAGFVATRAGRRRMAWKMSIDLSRPLVSSMGQHDPLDGLLTFAELQAEARRAGLGGEARALDGPLAEMRALCAGLDWSTADPLGLGGVLGDALRVAQLSLEEPPPETPSVSLLLDAAARGFTALLGTLALDGPAEQRLAFRELGLAIGLHALERLDELLARGALRSEERHRAVRRLESLRALVPLAGGIEEFWLEPEHQATRTWQAHVDINAVMLATSLVPDGFLAPGCEHLEQG